MNQTYVYRKHLRKSFKSLMLMPIVILVGSVIMGLGLLLSSEQNIKGYHLLILGIVSLVMFLFLSLEMGLMYLVFIKRFKSISVTLTEDAIVYTNAKGQNVIPYEDIERLEFPSVKYTGGWLKIIYKGGNIRLTVVLEHIGDFICELKERLEEKKIDNIYNEDKMFSFLKTAVYADESWERVYHNFIFQIATHFLCSILTIVMIMFFGNASSNLILILGSIFAPLLGYLVSEIIVGTQVKKRVKREEFRIEKRNLEFERKLFKICIVGFAMVYLFIIILSFT